MKTKYVATLILSCFLLTSTLTGCATVRSTSDTVADKTGMEKSTAETMTGAGIGAAAGALLGQIIGGDTKSTLIGAGIGAAIGGIFAHLDAKDRDLQAAEELAEKIKTAGMEKPTVTSTVKEETLVEKDGTPKKNLVVTQEKNVSPAKPGEIKKVAYFTGLSYPVPPSSLAAKSPTLSSTLKQTGEFAAGRDVPVQVVVEAANDEQGKWMAGEVKKGFGKGVTQPKITVKKVEAGKTAITVLPATTQLSA